MEKRLLATIILIASSITISSLSYCKVVDKIVVVVNNEIITQREVDRLLEPVYEQYRALYYGDELVKKMEEARRNVINQLIEDKLILSEAKKLNIQVEDKDLELRIDEVRKRFGSKEDFERALSEQGLMLKDLRTRYREHIMTRILIDERIGSKIAISPPEVSDYYNKHSNEYIQPEEIRLRNILIRPKKDLEPAKALETAREILRRLEEGGDFAGLAKKYSEGPNAEEGGLMGYVKKEDLLPEIEAIVFNLKEGELSDIVETGIGYHIFKVEERRERIVRDLSEVRHDVEEAIFREKVKGRLKGWIEGLKKNAYIAFK